MRPASLRPSGLQARSSQYSFIVNNEMCPVKRWRVGKSAPMWYDGAVLIL